jgi:hypothetical protein
MTEQEFDDAMDSGGLEDEYWDYVTCHGAGEISLHEDAIYEAIESGRYYDGFRESMIDKQ